MSRKSLNVAARSWEFSILWHFFCTKTCQSFGFFNGNAQNFSRFLLQRDSKTKAAVIIDALDAVLAYLVGSLRHLFVPSVISVNGVGF